MLSVSGEKRKNTGIHLRPSVNKAFRRYAKSDPDHSFAQLAERAMLEYMERNPINGITVNVTYVGGDAE